MSHGYPIPPGGRHGHHAVITGSGDQAFCTGMGLEMMSALAPVPLARDYLPVAGTSAHLTRHKKLHRQKDRRAAQWQGH